MNLSQKYLANLLENGIGYIFNRFNIKNLINHSNGIDCFLLDYDLFIEIKSCYSYRFRSLLNKRLRIGVYLINIKDLNSDYFIFIEVCNKIMNIEYIHSFKICVINIKDIKDYINKNNVKYDKYDNFCISIKQLYKINKIEIFKFIEILKNG